MIAARDNRQPSAFPFFLAVGLIHLAILFVHSLEQQKFGETDHSIHLKFISGQVAQAQKELENIVPQIFPKKSVSESPTSPSKTEAVSPSEVKESSPSPEMVSTQQVDHQQGVQTDNAMAIYTSRLRSLIETHQFYPQVARDLNQTGVVYVSFTVNSSGHIINVRVVKASGYKRLDEAAVALIQLVSGKLPFPRELNLAHLELEMPINYDLY